MNSRNLVCAFAIALLIMISGQTIRAASDAPTTANAPGILVSGATVSVFVPNSSDNGRKGGIGEATLESAPDPLPAPIQHRGAGVANSCAASAANDLVLCSGVFGQMYATVPGNPHVRPFPSGVHRQVHFSGGGCATCGMAIDDSLGLAIASTSAGYLPIQLAPAQGAPLKGRIKRLPMITLEGEPVSGNFGYDPVNHLIYSPNYQVTNLRRFYTSDPHFQIIQLEPDGTGQVYDLSHDYGFFIRNGRNCTPADGTPIASDALPDSAAIDTSTNIAYVTFRSRSACRGPNTVEDIALFDMTPAQATFTAPSVGAATGTWDTQGKQIETLSELAPTGTALNFVNGITGIAVVSPQHLAIIADRREGDGGTTAFGALSLPTTSGSGTPAIVDYVQASMPDDPAGQPWVMSYEPNGVTAYQSPTSGKAFGVVMNRARSYVAVVDLAALLNAQRSSAHTVDQTQVDLVKQNIVRFVALVPPRRRPR